MAGTFTYTEGAADLLNRVRFRIGDVDRNTSRPKLSDDEIGDLITAYGPGELAVSIEALRRLLARFAREADVGLKGAGLEATRRYERLRQLLDELLAESATSGGGAVSAVPVSEAYRTTSKEDDDLIQTDLRNRFLDADV